MGLRLLIEGFWCEVDTAGPGDSFRLRVHPDLGEVGRVIQRLQDARPSLGREVDITGCGVAEQQPEHVVGDHGNAHHDRQVVLTHTTILRQRLDSDQRLVPPGPLPVRGGAARSPVCSASETARPVLVSGLSLTEPMRACSHRRHPRRAHLLAADGAWSTLPGPGSDPATVIIDG
jgi:hypothetical protein